MKKTIYFKLQYYKNNDRRPYKVEYIDDLKEDLMRRDFTINSICIDKNGMYIDLLNGINDINNKIIFYFNDNGTSVYDNYSYNYVDENDMVVIVGLVDNSEEEQEWFRKNIVDSKYIRFEQGNHPVNE